MKQLLTIILLFPLFIACSSDDDNNNSIDPQLVGEWIQPAAGGILKVTQDKLDGYWIYFYGSYRYFFTYEGVGKIKTKEGRIITYKIEGDTLYWTEQTGLITFKRVREG